MLHIAQGSLAGVDAWFSDPSAQASANYCVGQNGEIHCYVDPHGSDAPFANGLVQAPDATVQRLLQTSGGGNLNFVTVSIEHAGFSGSPTQLTPAQLHASAWLTAWLQQTFHIPNDEDHLIGHYEIDSVTRQHCPGLDRAGWLAYEEAVAAFSVEPAPPADPRIAAAIAALPALELATRQLRQILTAAPAGVAPPDALEIGAR